jgi:hypothetical protein
MAQSVSDIEVAFFAYFKDGDESSVLLLGVVTSDIPGLAAEMVSPRNSDDFFDGFTDFRNYSFAQNLSGTYIDQIDEAEEYMVFVGDYVGGSDVLPSYLMLLSDSGRVFMLQGSVNNADDLFLLAQATINEGAAPEQFNGYRRVQTDTDSNGGSSPNNSQEIATANENLRILCSVDRSGSVAVMDLNSDGLLTIQELSNFTHIEGVDGVISSLVTNGYDAVQYVGC